MPVGRGHLRVSSWGGHRSACDMHMRMDARGTGPPARQQLGGQGIWRACDMHMRMDARGTCTPARQQPGEGIWSACDMHMRMDARGAGPPAGQQPGEGIWSACDMRMRMDARRGHASELALCLRYAHVAVGGGFARNS